VASKLADKPLRDVLSELASPAPTPGGGSACAAASALGAALLMMAASLAHTRSGSSDLDAARRVLDDIQRQLTEAIDADSAAYGRVVAAHKQRKATGAQQAARAAAIQQALRGATAVPLGLMRLSAAALEQARPVAAHTHGAAGSDVAVALVLLRGGLLGARLTVDANLRLAIDAGDVDAIRGECRSLSDQADAAASEAERLLRRLD
jgi:methenyltetrahydrofolate cyclohydrolase